MSPVTAARLQRGATVAFFIGFPIIVATVLFSTEMGHTTPRKRAKSRRAYQLIEERRFTSRARDF